MNCSASPIATVRKFAESKMKYNGKVNCATNFVANDPDCKPNIMKLVVYFII